MIGWRALATAAVALVLATGAGLLAAADAEAGVRDRLDQRSDRVAAILELELTQYRTASRAVAAVRAGDPSQAEWEAELAQLDVAEDLPSVYSIGAISLEPGPRLVVTRVAPLARNRSALGLDVLTVDGAHDAALRAVETQVATLSEPVMLAQEPAEQAGLAVYAPWYRPDGSVGGLANIVLRGQDFLDSLVREVGDLGVVVSDATPDRHEIARLVPPGGVEEGLAATRTVRALGQAWTVEVTGPVGFASTWERVAGPLVFTGVLLVGLLAAALVSVLARRAAHARREVAARTAELVATNHELEAALSARDEFLALVSHEFRTPITVIRGFSQMAVSGRQGDLPADTIAWLERVDRQAERLHRMVENVLTASNLRRQALPLPPQDVDLVELVRSVVDQHRDIAPVDLDLPPRLVVRADPGSVVRVLDDLLANAATYGRPPVRVAAWRQDGTAVLQVHDDGDGVPEGLGEDVFEAFRQGDRGDTRSARGIGLGLAVARELCVGMGGSIRLVAVDRGACFEVRLPAADAAGSGDHRG